MLKQERALESPTNQDMAVFRQNAERIIGGDDHVIRIDWVFATHVSFRSSLTLFDLLSQLYSSKTVTFQLLNKDDSSHEDPEHVAERWQAYVESFVSVGRMFFLAGLS